MRVLLVAIAGAAGAAARYVVDAAAAGTWSRRFPLGTLLVNVVGSAAAGVLVGLVARHGVGDTARAVVGTGFLGAFTTFSTFAVDTVRLAGDGTTRVAALYVGITLVATVALASAGYAVAVML